MYFNAAIQLITFSYSDAVKCTFFFSRKLVHWYQK